MAVYSTLLRPVYTQRLLSNYKIRNIMQNVGQVRNMAGDESHHHFIIQPSRYQFKMFKNLLHYFIMLGIIPIFTIITFANFFVGPAELTELTKGEGEEEEYIPKHWEYHRHPISRFLAKYLYPNPQQEYEKMCHFLYEENEKSQIRKLEKQVKNFLASRNDYQAYYYRPAIAKYHRISKEQSEYLESIRGDN